MEKIKLPLWQRVKTLLIVVLTLTMLLLAGIYIGGAHFAGGSAAIRTTALPIGTVAPGTDAALRLPVYKKGLLPLSAAAIRIGDAGGGAYGNEPAAGTLLSFAAEHIHTLLGQGASLTEVTANDFAAAKSGDHIGLNLLCALPYQMLYALTGEYTAPAGSTSAITADRLLLAFPKDGAAVLYLSDGAIFYKSETEISVKPAELSTLAHDSRLADFSMAENGILLSSAAPRAPRITLKRSTVTAAEYGAILPLFGYDPAAAVAPLSAESRFGTAVAPHGSLAVTEDGVLYTAARDSGIPISDFLDTAKSTLDIGIYDILLASVSLAESLREIAPSAFAEGGSLYLAGFFFAEDTYTVRLGLSADTIPVLGDAYPYFAEFSVQGGMLKRADVLFSALTQNSYTGMLFSSLWQYRYAAETARVDTLKLCYHISEWQNGWVDASWYFTGQKQEAEVAK